MFLYNRKLNFNKVYSKQHCTIKEATLFMYKQNSALFSLVYLYYVVTEICLCPDGCCVVQYNSLQSKYSRLTNKQIKKVIWLQMSVQCFYMINIKQSERTQNVCYTFKTWRNLLIFFYFFLIFLRRIYQK